MRFFLLYLFLEIAISVPAFSALGILGTFAEIIGSAFVGIVMLTNTRYTIGESLNALRGGNISPAAFQTLNIMTILGALFLIIPGVFTDILGLLMQFGFASTLVSSKIIKKDNNTYNTYEKRSDDEDIIDVEVIDVSNTKQCSFGDK